MDSLKSGSDLTVTVLANKVKRGYRVMDKISVIYDKTGNTLDVWFCKPKKAVCEEIGDGVILKKDKKRNILGFEKINFFKNPPKNIKAIPIKTIVR